MSEMNTRLSITSYTNYSEQRDICLMSDDRKMNAATGPTGTFISVDRATTSAQGLRQAPRIVCSLAAVLLPACIGDVQPMSGEAVEESEVLVEKWLGETFPPVRTDLKVVSVMSGKCVDREGESYDDFTNIHQWSCGSGDTPYWQLERTGISGAYYIRVKRPDGRWGCLGYEYPVSNGDNIFLHECHESQDLRLSWRIKLENQLWFGPNEYSIKLLYGSDHCLDVALPADSNGDNLQAWNCGSLADNKLFYFDE